MFTVRKIIHMLAKPYPPMGGGITEALVYHRALAEWVARTPRR